MTNRFLSTASVIALGLLAAVAPAYSSTSLTFETSAGAGSVTINGNTQNSSETLTSLSGIEYNEVVISGATDTADNGTWSLAAAGGTTGYATLSWSGGTLQLSGEFTTCSGCVGTVGTGAANINLGTGGHALSGILESGTTSLLYGTTPGFTTTNNAANVQFAAGTSLTEVANLIADLGLTGTNAAYTSSPAGGISAAGTASSGTYTMTAYSETLDVTIASTPEPVSFFLLGSGLLGIGLIARKRSVRI